MYSALEAGADINYIGGGGQTPLMHAVLGGYAEKVRWLLKEGADPSIPEKDGYTPPHGAGFQGRAEIVPILKEFGIDLNHRHQDGYTGVQRACWGKHIETIKAFLQHGARKEDVRACKNYAELKEAGLGIIAEPEFVDEL